MRKSAFAIMWMFVLWRSSPAQDVGTIAEWLIVGPSDTANSSVPFELPVGAPEKLAPAVDQAAGSLRWRKASATRDIVAIDLKLAKNADCITTAFVYVFSEKMLEVKLLMGFSEGGSVYVNGIKAFEQEHGGELVVNAKHAEIVLGKGWNRLQVNVFHYKSSSAPCGFTARLTDLDLKPIAGLVFSTDNPYAGGAIESPAYTPCVRTYMDEQSGTRGIRLVNCTPIVLENVELSVRNPAGKQLMTSTVGSLKGFAKIQVDILADEIVFQKEYSNAKASIKFNGGQLQTVLQPLVETQEQEPAYITPHIQRMRPWAGGRANVLVITADKTRQTEELFERGDFERHTISIPSDEKLAKAAEKQLNDELTLTQFDCIVIAAQRWDKIPLKARILELLRGGVGLVWINPTQLDAESEPFAGLQAGSKLAKGPSAVGLVSSAVKHWITAGVQFDALPKMDPFNIQLAPNFLVLAKANDIPCLAAREYIGEPPVADAKNRSVLLNIGGRPSVSYPLIWPCDVHLFKEQKRLPVWERQWSLLLRAITWAARKDTGIIVSAAAPPQLKREAITSSNLTVTIVSSKSQIDCTIEATFRSRGYDGVVVTQRAVISQTDPVSFQIPIPQALESGENEADIRVMAGERVMGWANCVFQIIPRASIKNVTLEPEKPYYLPEDKIAFSISGNTETANLMIVQLTDNHDRIVAEQKADLQSGDFKQRFIFSVKDIETASAHLLAMVKAPAGTEAMFDRVFFVRHELKWDDYLPCLWLTRCHPRWYYDIDYFKMLQDRLWIAAGWGTFDNVADLNAQMVQGGFDYVAVEGLHMFSTNHNWAADVFDPRRANFNKTKDIHWLYRTPLQQGKPTEQVDYSKLKVGNNPYNTYFPLEDPGYREYTKRNIEHYVKTVQQFNPLTYDLCDESSYTTYAQPMDFDFSPASLKEFRVWLKTQYSSLDALNSEWDTSFANWDDVMPMYTEQIKKRVKNPDNANYAPWIDHRRYNDIVYNDFVQFCSDSARAVDPDAYVGIGGGQHAHPYGGWDYWLVATHFTWIENYYLDTTEYIRSFNSKDRRLKACPGQDVYFSLSHGNSGFYRWVDCNHVAEDFELLPRGKETAAQLAEVRGRGFAKILLNADPVDDPIAIHYSQAAIQLAYVRGQGDGYGGPLNAKVGCYNLIQDMGRQYKFVSYAQLEAGELMNKGYKLMILPESAALSNKEAEELKKFVEAGNTLLCDKDTGGWDEHGRRRKKDVLAEYFGIDSTVPAEKKVGKGLVIYLKSDLPRRYFKDRKTGNAETYWKTMEDVFKKAGLGEARARLLCDGKPASLTEIRYFQLGEITYHVARCEMAGKYTFVNAVPASVYNMRDGAVSPDGRSLDVAMSAPFPALIAVSPYKIETVNAKADPPIVVPGYNVSICGTVKTSAKPSVHAFHFSVYGPDGKERRYYSQSILGDNGSATLVLKPALNDPHGVWKVKVSELASNATCEAQFEVK